MIRIKLLVVSVLCVLATGNQAQTAPTCSLSIVPAPVRVVRQTGHFRLSPGTVIRVDRATSELGHVLADLLAPATGFRLAVTPGQTTSGSTGSRRSRSSQRSGSTHDVIVLRTDSALSATLGLEGYRLDIAPHGVTLSAAAPAGVFYGIQTVRQLLPADVFRKSRMGHVEWTMPCVSIEDRPRFGWRGLMIDTSRHFMPKEFVE